MLQRQFLQPTLCTSSAYLEEKSIAGFGINCGLNSLGIGDSEIVTNELNVRLTHKIGPGGPIVLIEPILDGNDRVIRDEVLRRV